MKTPPLMNVRLEHRDLAAFIADFRGLRDDDLDLPSPRPRAPDELVHFVVRTADDSVALEGTGEVELCVDQGRSAAADERYEVTLRLSRLDEMSKVIVERIRIARAEEPDPEESAERWAARLLGELEASVPGTSDGPGPSAGHVAPPALVTPPAKPTSASLTAIPPPVPVAVASAPATRSPSIAPPATTAPPALRRAAPAPVAPAPSPRFATREGPVVKRAELPRHVRTAAIPARSAPPRPAPAAPRPLAARGRGGVHAVPASERSSNVGAPRPIVGAPKPIAEARAGAVAPPVPQRASVAAACSTVKRAAALVARVPSATPSRLAAVPAAAAERPGEVIARAVLNVGAPPPAPRATASPRLERPTRRQEAPAATAPVGVGEVSPLAARRFSEKIRRALARPRTLPGVGATARGPAEARSRPADERTGGR